MFWVLSGAAQNRAQGSIVPRGGAGYLVVQAARRRQPGCSSVPHNDANCGLIEPELLSDFVLVAKVRFHHVVLVIVELMPLHVEWAHDR